MPFRSKKQQAFAYANPEKFGGKKGLEEWSAATNFSKLPKKVKGGNTDLSTNSLKGHELSTNRADNLAAKKAFTTRPRAKGNKRY